MTPLRELRGHLSRAARMGAPYAATLELPDHFEIDPEATVDGLAETGLVFDPQNAMFAGMPVRPGTFRLRIAGHWRMTRAVVTVDLPISPDPFSLWQDIPSDPAAAFSKPDLASNTVADDLTLLMASRRGRKHANTGAFRDDDAGIAHDAGTGWHVGVTADGAGSASLSREGSRLAVAAVLDTLPKALARVDVAAPEMRATLLTAMCDAARAATDAIDESAGHHEAPPEDFATTLIIGVARRTEAGWLCASFSIGDGLAALWNAEAGTVQVMIAADTGDYAGQTRFLRRDLLDDAAACDARLFLARPDAFTAFCLMTDGVSDARFPTAQAEADPAHWSTLWREEIAPCLATPDPAAALCDWLHFRVPGEHDDRSIVLMLPAGAN